MALTTICDICSLPLVADATSVQIIPGRVHPRTGGVSATTARAIKSYTICTPCADRVADHLQHLVNGENIAAVHPDGGSCPIADARAHVAAG